jgi:hypothetical protein
MENQSLSLEKFNPTTAELTALAERSKKLVVTDLGDKAQLALVHDYRMELKSARVRIEKCGMAIREDANKFQKAVIAKERELVALIEPEEARLKEIEEKAKNHAVMEERRRKLPERVERLKAVEGDYSEEWLLEMDDVAFEAEFNRFQAAMNERAAAKIAAESRAAREEQEAKEKELREREEKLAAEKRAHDEKVAKEEAERLAREKEEQEAKERAAREEQEAKEKLEREEKEEAARQAALKAEERFQKFLADNGWTDELAKEFVIADDGPDSKEIHLFKKVASFLKEA